MNYQGLDLNLLIALKVLLDERHVTRSAERLGITQPAMSASLARLRSLLGDQILVRGPQGLARTPRAEELRQQLDQVMDVVDRIVARPSTFVPRSSRRCFTLIGSDFIEAILLPPLLEALTEEAPALEIVFKDPDPKSIEAGMAAGALDFAIGYLPDAPAGLIETTLFHEPFVCITRPDHPAVRDGALSLEDYVEMQHVQVLMRGGAMYAAAVDEALAEHGLVRRVALWQPSFLAALPVVARTNLVATVPRRVASYAAAHAPVHVCDVPLPLPLPRFALYWHARSRADPGHRWMRDRIVALLRG